MLLEITCIEVTYTSPMMMMMMMMTMMHLCVCVYSARTEESQNHPRTRPTQRYLRAAKVVIVAEVIVE